MGKLTISMAIFNSKLLVITMPGKSLLTPWPFGFPILLAAGTVHLDGLLLFDQDTAKRAGPSSSRTRSRCCQMDFMLPLGPGVQHTLW